MELDTMTPDASLQPRARSSVWSLILFLFLSLLFCLGWGLSGLLGVDTFEQWIGYMIAWGVIWVVFALLQIRWWARGDEKF